MRSITRRKAASIGLYIIKLSIALVFIFPLIIGLLFALHPEEELSRMPLYIFPQRWTFENFIDVFKSIPLLGYLKNTFIVCSVAIACQVVFGSLAAYSFVYMHFPGKALLWTVIISTMAIPGEVVVITNYVTVQNMGLINTYAGMFITHLISGAAIFMMRQFYKQLPRDFREAATLDGCGDVKYLVKIAIPLSTPTVAAVSIYQFVHIYNAYFWPLLVTNKDKWRTIQVGISYLVTGDVDEYGNVLAGAMVALVFPLIAFILGQEYIIKGMVSGGIKG